MTMLGKAKTPKARKSHICTWCGEIIVQGETYTRYAYDSDGDLGTCKMHAECYQAMIEHDFGHDATFHVHEFNRGCCCENGHCECK